MNFHEPLWMNEPDADQASIRFSCPYCNEWIRKREFERHIQEQHLQGQPDKLLALRTETLYVRTERRVSQYHGLPQPERRHAAQAGMGGH